MATAKKAAKKTAKKTPAKKAARKTAKKAPANKSADSKTAKKVAKKAAKKSAKKAAGSKNKLGVKNSLVNNINARKKKGISRPKNKKTVDSKSYDKMEDGWKE